MPAQPPLARAIVPWDIVRVDFSFADEAATRRRPALVIAAPSATDAFSIIWVLMITSANRGPWPLDVPVSDLRRGGLPRACVVRTSKVATFDSRIADWIGELAEADRTKVSAAVRTILGTVMGG
jgi:mRNA-degrading endonuclease toxin of MazEF toxin-antitoxin module